MKKTANTWHQTWQGHAFWTVTALLICYGFASWAIDSGHLLHYAAAVVALLYAIHSARLAIRAWRKRP